MNNEENICASMGTIKKIHFVGIGGVGMSGIAEVLHTQGYTITGSDLSESQNIKRLKKLGMTIFNQHSAEQAKEADVLVVSSAISDDNPEVVYAHKKRIPIVPRAVMLGELMRFRYGIAVSGTHGKTTTTSLISHIMAEAKLDPTFVVGGQLANFGRNAKLGSSKYIVVEADESDASFLYLRPMLAVITNIDKDHMETYDGKFSRLQDYFQRFLELLPFYGMAVLCIDDPSLKQLINKVSCYTTTYGFDSSADLCATNCKTEGLKSTFTVQRRDRDPLQIEVNLPGRHNVLNIMAAIGVLSYLGLPDEAIVQGLKNFKGVGRRFDIHGSFEVEKGECLLLDDYGHHPNEIDANIKTIRDVLPDRRIVMLFQPHRYSRMKALFYEFAQVLSSVDQLFLLDVYSAGEEEIPEVNSKNLYKNLSQVKNMNVQHIERIDDCYDVIAKHLRAGDVLVTQGAGVVNTIAKNFSKKFKVKEHKL